MRQVQNKFNEVIDAPQPEHSLQTKSTLMQQVNTNRLMRDYYAKKHEAAIGEQEDVFENTDVESEMSEMPRQNVRVSCQSPQPPVSGKSKAIHKQP